MGSFSDLFLCPGNGHTIAADRVGPVNARLARLRVQLYTLARAHQRTLCPKPNPLEVGG